MVKEIYKFRNIVVISENNNDFIRLQQVLLDCGLRWYSGATRILYKFESSGYFYVSLEDRKFGMGEITDRVSASNRPSTDSKLYGISDILSIQTIIRYGRVTPSYKPRNIKI
jgi:hypothetical protein